MTCFSHTTVIVVAERSWQFRLGEVELALARKVALNHCDEFYYFTNSRIYLKIGPYEFLSLLHNILHTCITYLLPGPAPKYLPTLVT